jgi:hypothetical protein
MRRQHHVVVAHPYYDYGFYNGFYYPYAWGPSVYVEPVYDHASYVEPHVYSSSNQSDTNLSYQVEKLTREVERLRQDQADSSARLLSALTAPVVPQPPPIPITLVFRDGRRLVIQNYAIVGQTLWALDERTSTKIPLDDLDFDATQQANPLRTLLLPRPAR